MAFKKPRKLEVLTFLFLTACAPGTSDVRDAVAACNADRSSTHHVEVYVRSGRVTRVLGDRPSLSGAHEGFDLAASGYSFRVEDNTNITGPIPLRAGETISLLGQLECNDDVIHWTHHDSRGRHISGYIQADGRRYQ